MDEIIARIAHAIEFGKVDQASPYPPDLAGQPGADELTRDALDAGIEPERLLNEAFITGMERVGKKFSERRIFVPQMLMSARAMSAAMAHLKPYFQSGAVKRKGTFVIGTVAGDLHDIGKNLVAMMVEGAGWEVVDLGVDVSADRFVEALRAADGCRAVGLSAMLTTTMIYMEEIVRRVREEAPGSSILVGGAPLNDEFRARIGADSYSRDPQGAVDFLDRLVTT